MANELFGTDLFGEPISQTMTGRLSEQFLVSPFSTISTRDGWWQERKRAWMSLGIKGEEGRKNDLLFGNFNRDYLAKYKKGGMDFEATSVFDPVICETIYRWFAPEKSQIVDPFCGGSVRGIVAGCLGHRYWGVDLRQEQVDANKQQNDAIKPDVAPIWVCGDAETALKDAPQADLVFSCPPYGDLETYSDHKDDLSNMDYHVFMRKYFKIIEACYATLKQNRFACFVVGDYRDSDGHYHNFVGETATLFQTAGFHYYNEAILLNVVGTAAIRAARQFNGKRKLVKVHQNILVFVKGDAKLATLALEKSTKETTTNEKATIRDSETGDGRQDQQDREFLEEINQQGNFPSLGAGQDDRQAYKNNLQNS